MQIFHKIITVANDLFYSFTNTKCHKINIFAHSYNIYELSVKVTFYGIKYNYNYVIGKNYRRKVSVIKLYPKLLTTLFVLMLRDGLLIKQTSRDKRIVEKDILIVNRKWL